MLQKISTHNKLVKYAICIIAVVLLMILIVISYNHYQYKYSPMNKYGFMCKVVEGNIVIVNARKDLTEIVIPAEINGKSVIGIGASAFAGSNSLTSVTLPDSITYIDDLAFQNCNNLSTIQISKNLLHIGLGSFSGCHSLKAISLPNTVTSISSLAFNECSNLESIRIPDKVTRINNGTFKGCKKLSYVSIPKNMANIADNAFENCSALDELFYRGSSDEWHRSNMFYNMGPLFKVNCADGKFFSKFEQ